MAAFRGTQNFNGGGQLLVAVDFAVFAPGQFTGLDPVTGLPPVGYVYAYQAFNNSTTQAMVSMSIGYDAGAATINTAGNTPTYPLVGGLPADLVDIGPDSVTAFYINGGNALLPGTYSSVWIYTSLQGPSFASASVDNPSYQDQKVLPSPVPEPTTLGLLAFGVLALVRRRINKV